MGLPVSLAGLLMVGLLAFAGQPSAAPTAKKVVTLGETDVRPKPACPKGCQVIASVTGFQTQLAGRKLPFRVPFDARITGWKIYLGKPNQRDLRLLNNKWGRPPQAAIAVLRKRRSGKYELKRRSPTQSLGSKLGKAPSFQLPAGERLRVSKGDQVGLIVPTWIPAFKAGLQPGRNAWRAGRSSKRCNPALESITAQIEVGSTRPYGCGYEGARLLYTVQLESR